MGEKLVRGAERLLRASGLASWDIVAAHDGKEHHEVFIAGRRVCILSKGGGAVGHDLKKLQSAIAGAKRATA